MTFKFVVINRGSTIQATFIMEKNSIIDIYYTKKWYNKNGIMPYIDIIIIPFFWQKNEELLEFLFFSFLLYYFLPLLLLQEPFICIILFYDLDPLLSYRSFKQFC